MSTTVETLFKITASVVGSNAIKDLAGDIAKVSTNGQNLQRTLNQAAMGLKAFAYSEAVTGLKDIAMEAIHVGAELKDVSEKTGVSVRQLAQLKGAGDATGTTLDSIGNSVAKLNKSIVDSADATSRQSQAFKALGISTRDTEGHLKNSGDILLEIADRFHNTQDGAGKTAVAIDLLGKSGADMIPLLNKGSDAIKELGLSVGPDFAEQSERFQENVSKMKTTFAQFGIDLTNEVLPGLNAITESTEKSNIALTLLTGTIKVLETAFVGWQTITTTVLNVIGEDFAHAQTSVEGFYKVLMAVKDFRFSDVSAIRAATDAEQKNITATSKANLEASLNQYQQSISKIWDGNGGIKGAGAKGPLDNAPPSGKGNLDGYNPGAGSKAASDAEAAAKAAAEWIAKQKESLVTLQQEAQYIGKTTVEITKMKDARALETEIAEKAAKMTSSQAEAFKAQARAIEQARQGIIQYNYDQSRTFGAGASEFFASYTEAATDSASQIKQVMSTAFTGAENALVEFTTTGKLNIKSFASSVIQDLIRIQIQRSVLQPLSGVLSSIMGGLSGGFGGGGAASSIANPSIAGTSYLFANGGIMTDGGKMPLNKYSNGGVANSPQLAMYGEGRMPEAYVPLPDGRSIPVSIKGGGAGGGDTVINMTINVEGGGNDVQSNTQQGAELGKLVAGIVKNTLINEKMPGGILTT